VRIAERKIELPRWRIAGTKVAGMEIKRPGIGGDGSKGRASMLVMPESNYRNEGSAEVK
jgi:hypothetical protein